MKKKEMGRGKKGGSEIGRKGRREGGRDKGKSHQTPASCSLLYLCGSFAGVRGAAGSAKRTGPAATSDQHRGTEVGECLPRDAGAS